jgi:LysM repeat protein
VRRNLSDVQRRLVLATGSIVIALLGAACGSSDTASPTGSTITVEATSFATLPTTPTTLPNQTTVPVVAGEQKYTVQSGDYPLGVAQKFGVTLDAMNAANAATPGYSAFFAGLEIIIPAGGTPQVATTTIAGQAPATTVPPAGATTTTTAVAGGQPNCGVGSYTLVAGDYPTLVAKKFDTTVQELDAINADTPGYSAFYVGLVIKIPAKTAC